jgi:hypothetical protein
LTVVKKRDWWSRKDMIRPGFETPGNPEWGRVKPDWRLSD